MNDKLTFVLMGAGLLLVLKYGIVGLDAWNAALHPGLVIAPNQQQFRKPLLGLLG